MNDVPRVRLFVAVSIPRSHLDWLQAATAELRTRWPRARWTVPENQHVTLKFLGSTPVDRLEPLGRVLNVVAATHRPAELELGKLGAFPSERRVRVLWAGLEDPEGLLARLATDLGAALEPLGYAQEERPFRAHLTLARFREPQRNPGGLPDLDLSSLPSFSVAAFELFRSHLSPKGARYEVLQSFSLGAVST